MDIDIRLLTGNDFIQANQLYQIVNKKNRPDTFFNWEFIDAPFGPAIYVGAFDGEKLVGTQAAIPMEMMNAKGEIVVMAKSEDTLLDPAYRGQGLFDKMYKLLFAELIKQNIVGIWGFTYAKKPFLKIGFDIPFDTETGVLVLKPFAAFHYLSKLNPLNKFIDKCKIGGLCLFSFLKGIAGASGNTSLKEFSIADGFLCDKEKLIQSVLQSEFWMLRQNKIYIDWRLHKNPYANEYHEIILKDKSGKICGNITYNLMKSGVAYICQMLISTEVKKDIGVAFVNEVIKRIRNSNNVNLIRFWGFRNVTNSEIEIDYLEKAGFYFVKKGTGFVIKTLEDTRTDFKNIFLSRLYTQGNL